MEPYEKKTIKYEKMTVGTNIYTVNVIKEFFLTLKLGRRGEVK